MVRGDDRNGFAALGENRKLGGIMWIFQCIFDGIIELLKNLLSLDYKMGIVTSKTREEFTHDFCPFGISHYFKTIICADDTQEHKPNAAPILKYVELSKTDHRKVKKLIY